MPQLDAIQKQLQQFRIANEDNTNDDHHRWIDAMKSLSKKLQGIGLALLNLDESGKEFYHYKTDEKSKKALEQIRKSRQEFDRISVADRKKLFQIIAPKMTDWLEAAWQQLKLTPYQQGYQVRPFRAPNNPEFTLTTRLAWLERFIGATNNYKPDILTVGWLAQWSPHAFQWQSEVGVPLLIAALDSKSKEGDEVFDILRATILREHPIGIMGEHVTRSLLGASRPEGWELMEKTLLAAQRQEGLRQTIVQNIDTAHPEAFRRMLRLIVDENLIRFSSICRSIDVWFGLLWDSASTKVMTQYVEEVLQFLESPKDRNAALKSDDAETVYRALWVLAYQDVAVAVPAAAKLLKHSKDEVRYVAVWVLSMIGTPTAHEAKLTAMDDENLQVALLAASGTSGMNVEDDFDDEDEPKVSNSKTFDRLETLIARLPEKPQKLKAIVWPWTERQIERTMLTSDLLRQLGDRPPTRMLPHLKGMNSWEVRSVVDLLAKQKKWDELTRTSLFELTRHGSSDVREAAFAAVEKVALQDEERQIIEALLTRKSADVRAQSIALLLKGKDAVVLPTAQRLCTAKDRNQRLAGLELCRQLVEAERLKPESQALATAYREKQKKLLPEEDLQIAMILAEEREILSLDNALGLMNPAGRSAVVKPQKKKVPLITPAAIACLKALDDLVHEHRKEIVEVKNWSGTHRQPLGEVSPYHIPNLDHKKPLAPQLAKFPLIEVWQKWLKERPIKQKDKDGLELVRALVAAEMFQRYGYSNLNSWMKNPEQKKLAVAVLGEVTLPTMRYLGLVEEVVDWLLFTDLPKSSIDYLLDAVENSYALVTDEMNKAVIEKPETSKSRRSYWDDDDDKKDWRNNTVLEKWPAMLNRVIALPKQELTAGQRRRVWELARFHDEPIAGATRRRLDFTAVVEAYTHKLATYDDLVDSVLGPNRGTGWQGGFRELSQLTNRFYGKQKGDSEVLPEVAELATKVRERILEIELNRGEAPTPATGPAFALGSLFGVETLFRILNTLNKTKLKPNSGYGDNSEASRPVTLTQLVRVTYPSENDTPADFARLAKAAIDAGTCTEERLLELAFLAPQWTKFIETTLKWNGFSEGLYWFIAHMSSWGAQAAAAEAEGIVNETVEEIEDDDDDEAVDESDDNTESIPKPVKLTPWQRLVLERTPLTIAERQEGAVDVAWFHRTWKELGEERWQKLAASAKFADNAAQAKKAQFLADVLLGNTTREVLVDGIKTKMLKEYVRLLGLLPLAKGKAGETDILERYEILQGYKKYARTLSGLTKPAAMRAVEIGFDNLARLAGYPDPLRLEWAMEAESIRDLATAPVTITKDDITVSLSIDDNAKPQLSIQRGDKPLKAIPAATKKKHPEFAELTERAKELRKKSSRIKQSLEAAMCRGDSFSGAELTQLFQHAMLAPQIQRLVLIGDGIIGYPDKAGKALRDHAGKLEPVKKNEQLRIAHPSDFLNRGDWDKWQHDCFAAERVQAFKQIFRELYVVTKQEKKDGASSTRFAGQQIGPRQAMALWGSRGWHTQDEVFKIFHETGLIAEVNFQYDVGTAAEIEGLTLDTIQFRHRDEYKPMPLADVPPRIFSEAMRDIDLVVSVAHRGEVDPEATASTVEMRAALIRETCQLLGLKNVTLKENHAFIDGHYAEYSLHLGSGNIHRLPGGALAIIPVHAQHRGRIFLPFADDDPRTAEVMSKVLLLARDEEILDPMILEQLGAPADDRKSITLATPSKPKKSGSRRFELSDGKANKFWEIELDGEHVTTKWGRIGSDGQTKTKSFADADKAKAEYDKLLAEKTSKGYSET